MKNIVIIKCPTCPTWLSCEFDPGEMQIYEHPGQPAMWYSTNDTYYDSDIAADAGNGCDHDGAMDRADWENFQARCERIDAESFEDDSLESQYRLEAEGEAKYWEEYHRWEDTEEGQYVHHALTGE